VANIIDELVLSLGIDASKFEKGRRQADDALKRPKDSAVKHSKDIESGNKIVAESFEKVAAEALSFFAVLAGAKSVKDFIAQINEAQTSLGRFSEGLGESPQFVSEWGMAVQRMGGSAADAQATIATMSKALFDLHHNGKALTEVYRLASAAGRAIDTEHGLPKFMNDMAAAAQQLAKTDRHRRIFGLKARASTTPPLTR
jgi:hypothetical protein